MFQPNDVYSLLQLINCVWYKYFDVRLKILKRKIYKQSLLFVFPRKDIWKLYQAIIFIIKTIWTLDFYNVIEVLNVVLSNQSGCKIRALHIKILHCLNYDQLSVKWVWNTCRVLSLVTSYYKIIKISHIAGSPNNYNILKGYYIFFLWRLTSRKASKQKFKIAFQDVIIIWTNIAGRIAGMINAWRPKFYAYQYRNAWIT